MTGLLSLLQSEDWIVAGNTASQKAHAQHDPPGYTQTLKLSTKAKDSAVRTVIFKGRQQNFWGGMGDLVKPTTVT